MFLINLCYNLRRINAIKVPINPNVKQMKLVLNDDASLRLDPVQVAFDPGVTRRVSLAAGPHHFEGDDAACDGPAVLHPEEWAAVVTLEDAAQIQGSDAISIIHTLL